MTREGNFYKTHSGTTIQNTEHGESSDVMITGRPYREVLGSLAIDVHERRDGQVFLSLGDGLSDFPARFEEATGATVISSDPIYKIIRSTDTPDEARAKIQAAGLPGIAVTRSEKKMVRPEDLEHLRNLKRKGGDIVADVELLPFEDGKLDGIVSAHALRYIDMTKCLPEFLRVLKSRGEMRFGHPGFEVKKQGGNITIYPDKKHSDEYRNKLITFLSQSSEPLHLYVLYEEKEGAEIGTVHTLVITKTENRPVFAETAKNAKGGKTKYLIARINCQDIITGTDGKPSWRGELLE